MDYKCQGFPKESLHLPGPDFIDRVWVTSDQSSGDLRSLAALFGHGPLAGAGYGSILPMDVGVKHSDATCLTSQKLNFDSGTTIKLTIERGLDFCPNSKKFLTAGWEYMRKISFDRGISQNNFIPHSFVHKHSLFAGIEQAFSNMQTSQSIIMSDLEATKNKLNEYQTTTQADMEKLRSEIKELKDYILRKLLKDEIKRIKWIIGTILAVMAIQYALMTIK